MRPMYFSMAEETRQEQSAAGRYHPAPIVRIVDRKQGWRLPLKCGSHDDVSVFRHLDFILVLNVNTGLGYCGLEVFDLEGKLEGEVFLQRDFDVAETLGRRGLDLTHANIARKLFRHVDERW